jgi:hypothetical protein
MLYLDRIDRLTHTILDLMQLHKHVGDRVDAAVDGFVWDQVWDQVEMEVRNQVCRAEGVRRQF